MWFTSLFGRLMSGFRRRGRRPRGRATYRPTVEALETRTLPAVNFAAVGPFSTGGYNLASLPAGDFNHDGITDLASVNTGTSTLGVLLGRGDGTFSDPTVYPVGTGINAAAVGDLDGDGNLDLVVADQPVNTVYVLRGNGDGTFGAPLSY